MLTPSRQSKRFGSIGAKRDHPLKQAFRVNQLPRAGRPVNDLDVGVAGVFVIETLNGAFEAAAV
jgi:hypothetical protein